jgi:phage-related protein
MAIPTLIAKQDWGSSRTVHDRRQFIDFGGVYRSSYTIGVAKSARKIAVKFSRNPEKAQEIYDFLDGASNSPGYFKWQPVGDRVASYWSVDPESLEMIDESFGRSVVSVKLTEWRTVGGVV